MQMRTKWLAAGGSSFFFVAFGCAIAASQGPVVSSDKLDTVSVSLTLREASLADAIGDLHKKTGLNFAIDGAPLKPAETIVMNGTVRQALDQVAKAYGYSWKRAGTGAILMRKTFTDPDDFPQVNLLEWQSVAHDLNRFLARFPPPLVGFQLLDVMKAFYASLTPEEKQVLTEKHSLSAEQFSNEQLSLLNQMNLGARFTLPQMKWTAFDRFLKDLPKSSVQITPKGDFTVWMPAIKGDFVVPVVLFRHDIGADGPGADARIGGQK